MSYFKLCVDLDLYLCCLCLCIVKEKRHALFYISILLHYSWFSFRFIVRKGLKAPRWPWNTCWLSSSLITTWMTKLSACLYDFRVMAAVFLCFLLAASLLFVEGSPIRNSQNGTVPVVIWHGMGKRLIHLFVSLLNKIDVIHLRTVRESESLRIQSKQKGV